MLSTNQVHVELDTESGVDGSLNSQR